MRRAFLSELRQRYKGQRFIGPVFLAETSDEAERLAAKSPYRICGELLAENHLPDGNIESTIRHLPSVRAAIKIEKPSVH